MSADSGPRSGAVVTLGETMALITAPSGRHLRGGTELPVGIGGAESNVAIGLARLNVPVTWISRVGDDAFGSLVTREIRAEGVRVTMQLVLTQIGGGAERYVCKTRHTRWRRLSSHAL